MSNREEDLAGQIARIQEMAKDNPEIDAPALIKNLMEGESQKSLIPAKMKTRAYLISLLAPPFGLYYVVKFFLQAESDARKQAWICLALTGAGLLILQLLGNILFSSPELQEIQNINLKDIQELLN